MKDFAEIEKAVVLFRDLPCPWYVCGGWAIDLFVGKVTRVHKDIDIAVAREDQLIVRDFLAKRSWQMEKAISGKLIPWAAGEWISLPVHGVWCRNENYEPDFIEILLNEIDDKEFRFRRDESIRLPVERMCFQTASRLKVLAPEIVLLYKSGSPDENVADFHAAVEHLSFESRQWLKESLIKLYSRHQWIERL